MSTLRVSNIESSDEFTDLTIKTSNAAGPTLVMSSANDTIYLNGTLSGLTFPEVNTAVALANDAANTAISAADAANAAAAAGVTTGKAIAMAIVFG
jgi:hypothetical protein